jgi:signal transduction histidine kinase/CheY-like chemotaxis protein
MTQDKNKQVRTANAKLKLLNNIIERVNDGIVALDNEWRYTYVNERAAHILQKNNSQDLIGKHIWTEYPEGVGQPFHQAYLEAYETQQVIIFEEYYLPWDKWFENRVYPSSDGLTIYFTEITERKKTEELLRRTQKMDAIGKLTGGIAHDFNNLLGIILGNLELLESQINLDEKAVKRIQTINEAGLRAAQITSQLLNYSRREASQLAVIDINQMIGEMAELIPASLTPQIEINYKMLEELWLTKIDPGDFKDALLNLCINARDCMEGVGSLHINTRNITVDEENYNLIPGMTPGQYVEMLITDTGEGILKEDLEHIFEPFFTTKGQGQGTGLGLAMVYAFVKRSNGYIKCNSEIGVGSTFLIYLPREKSDQKRTKKDNKKTELLPRGGETILVVDDEIALMEMAQDILESVGYHVLTACNGADALEILSNSPEIDLLFSDVVMPNGMNGYELSEQATNKQSDLKVLLTSGITEDLVPHKSHSANKGKLLKKPYNLSQLVKQVRSTLDDPQ